MPKSCSDSNHANLKPYGLALSLKLGLLAAMVATVISVFLPNYYLSEVKILPADSKASGSLGQLAAAAAAMGVGVPGMDSGDANFTDILSSRTVREDLLKTEFQFRIRSWRFGPEKLRKQTLYNFIQAKSMDRAVEKVGNIISTAKDLKTKIISIKVETKSPELSQLIAKKATEDLESFVLTKGRTKGGEKARFADARLKEAREGMAQAEDTLRRFIEVNKSFQVSIDPFVRLTGMRLEAELKLRQQLVVTLAMNLEQALLEEKNDVPIVNILDSANLPTDKSSPMRSLIVSLTFILASAGSWVCLNRNWLKARLIEADEDDKGVVPDKESA